MKSLQVARTADSNLQMTINISVIFNYLRQHGPSYRAKISKDLNISAPAVSRAVERLVKRGYVIEDGTLKGATGKPAARIAINLQKGSVLGIDLLPDMVRMGVFNFDGECIRRFTGSRLTSSENIGADLVREIRNFLEEIENAREDDIVIPEVTALCIGVPAVVDVENGKIISAVLYENLASVDMKSLVENALGIPVYIENTVKLAALAEKRYGKGQDYNHVLFIDISNGIGAGIILGNNIVRGAFGAAGEIGFSVLSRDNLDFQAANKGSLEKIASLEGICEQAENRLQRGEESILSDVFQSGEREITAQDVFRAASDGDRLSVDIMQKTVDLLLMTVMNIILVINPEVVIIGGDICTLEGAEELIVSPIRRRLKSLLPFREPGVVLSDIGENVGVVGASVMAIESLLTGKYPYRIDR